MIGSADERHLPVGRDRVAVIRGETCRIRHHAIGHDAFQRRNDVFAACAEQRQPTHKLKGFCRYQSGIDKNLAIQFCSLVAFQQQTTALQLARP